MLNQYNFLQKISLNLWGFSWELQKYARCLKNILILMTEKNIFFAAPVPQIFLYEEVSKMQKKGEKYVFIYIRLIEDKYIYEI